MNTAKQNLELFKILKIDNNKVLNFYPKSIAVNIHTNKICIPTLDGNLYLDVDDILYCRANGSYTIIYTKNKKPIIVSKVLKWLGERLSKAEFIRVHHSYIARKKSIINLYLSICSNITMSDETVIPVARSRKHFVASELSNVAN